MPTIEQINEQRQLLAAHRRTLGRYLKQLADLGSQYAPPGLLNGIEDTRNDIRHIKGVLRGWGVTVENHPNDEEHNDSTPFNFDYFQMQQPYLKEPLFPEQEVFLEDFRNLKVSIDESDTQSLYIPPKKSVSSSQIGDDSFIGVIIVVFIIGIIITVFSPNDSPHECTDTICFGQTKQGLITNAGEQVSYTFTAVSGDKIIAIASRTLDDPSQGALEPKIKIEPKPPAELATNCMAGDPIIARVRCTLTSRGFLHIAPKRCIIRNRVCSGW